MTENEGRDPELVEDEEEDGEDLPEVELPDFDEKQFELPADYDEGDV